MSTQVREYVFVETSVWQPIDTAPKDGTSVLIAFVEKGHPQKPFVGEAEFRGTGWWWPNDYEGGCITPAPTHWMPLPDPPNA